MLFSRSPRHRSPHILVLNHRVFACREFFLEGRSSGKGEEHYLNQESDDTAFFLNTQDGGDCSGSVRSSIAVWTVGRRRQCRPTIHPTAVEYSCVLFFLDESLGAVSGPNSSEHRRYAASRQKLAQSVRKVCFEELSGGFGCQWGRAETAPQSHPNLTPNTTADPHSHSSDTTQ